MRMPSAEVAASGLRQCQQAQGQLEDAINGVMKAEQQLRENVREVRSELQSCVSRQQEALRCREVWLLGQIELLEQLKTETLQQQLQQLHWLRGQFDVIAHQLQNSNSTNNLNNQLTSCMEKLSSLSLTPEETPEMSFHADTRSLRQAITSFGSITAQLVEGVCSQNPAPQRGQLQSCPIAGKNQKTEVGALGDWLLGTRPTSSAPIGYQSSKNPQDWLVSHKESKTSCPVLASVDFLQAWGQLRDLEAWLLQDQTPVSRERTSSSSSSCSSSFSIEKIDESEFTVTPEEEGDEEELSDWLITPPTVAMETMSDAERWQQVLKPFEDSWLSSDWLVGSSRPAADCSSCCQTTRAVEIENLGLLKCLKTPPASSPASPASPTSPAPAVSPPVPALEAWLQQAVPVQQTCKANELCSTYSDCICEENCGREALSLWLLQQDGRDKNGVPVAKNTPPIMKTAPPSLYHREQGQKVQAILEAWLHPANAAAASSSCRTPLQAHTSSLSGWVTPEEEKGSREDRSSQFKHPSSSSPFQHPLDPDLWVLQGKTLTPAPVSGDQPRPAEEEDKWLLKKRTQAQERLVLPTVCDLFSCMKVGGDKEKWLHKAPVQM
ncbi:nuclear receptor coactivator 4 isoform X3 [Xiphias gladius]|uniref:nuclear receptor coactivator 4 isoform X2 n=1 Tax=Xiphias gladius TaxID=8245 RepID=UPI001A983712|nr:nuclear receptor coactivator 4 isoform X2 [Xiphias gladius]XP_039994538.1 nuclear receptor coactivator 4 isoform X3 [Xiphias gladius]